MKKQGRYFLGRIHKVGILTTDKIIEAIQNPISIRRGRYNWTIVGVHEGKVEEAEYLYGELTKYDIDGEVAVVDANNKKEQMLTAPGLIVDKSPFVFFLRVFLDFRIFMYGIQYLKMSFANGWWN